jgi:hypothetical protein
LGFPAHAAEQFGSSAPAHAPPVQTSFKVQVLLSLQAVPSAIVGLLHTPAVQVPATWHWSEAVQTIAVPPQTPLVHTSDVVQASLSLQVDPFVLIGLLHTPAVQVPAAWHWSEAVQTIAVPPQTPLVHASDVVQALLSSQVVPLAIVGLLHTPAVQVPATWHWSEAVQTIAVPPQTPLVHTSDVVHALLSLQVEPFVLIGLLHTPAEQVPASWH